jgi:hypothetical protein
MNKPPSRIDASGDGSYAEEGNMGEKGVSGEIAYLEICGIRSSAGAVPTRWKVRYE